MSKICSGAWIPSEVINIIYDKAVENTESASDLGEVLRELGFVVKEHFVTAVDVFQLPKIIPKCEIVFIHMDPEEKLPMGSRLEPTRFLEQNFPYTWGFPHEFSENCLWKSLMNKLFEQNSIPHCRTLCIESVNKKNRQAIENKITQNLKPPFFVKIDAGMNSEGLSVDNVAGSSEQAVQVAERLLAQRAGGVAVQEYLPGREFTVAVYGSDAQAMHPIERIFDEGELYSPPDGTKREQALEQNTERTLIEECREIASRAFAAINTKSAECYGRVDLRCDVTGSVRVLEVNDTCGFGPNSYFAMSCKSAGKTREQVLTELLLKQETKWKSVAAILLQLKNAEIQSCATEGHQQQNQQQHQQHQEQIVPSGRVI